MLATGLQKPRLTMPSVVSPWAFTKFFYCMGDLGPFDVAQIVVLIEFPLEENSYKSLLEDLTEFHTLNLFQRKLWTLPEESGSHGPYSGCWQEARVFFSDHLHPNIWLEKTLRILRNLPPRLTRFGSCSWTGVWTWSPMLFFASVSRWGCPECPRPTSSSTSPCCPLPYSSSCLSSCFILLSRLQVSPQPWRSSSTVPFPLLMGFR